MNDIVVDIEKESEEKMAGSSSDLGHFPFTEKIAGLNPAPATRIAFKGWQVRETTININGTNLSRLSIT